MAELNGDADRRHIKRRENDRWLIEMIEEIVKKNAEAMEEQRRRSRRALKSLAIGYVFLMFGLFAALTVVERRDKHRSDVSIAAAHDVAQTTYNASLASCHRVNLLREEANLASDIIFATLWASAQRERKLATTGPQTKTHASSAQQLEYLARLAVHTPMTDCSRAVDQALRYAPPRPRPFDPKTDKIIRKLGG